MAMHKLKANSDSILLMEVEVVFFIVSLLPAIAVRAQRGAGIRAHFYIDNFWGNLDVIRPQSREIR